MQVLVVYHSVTGNTRKLAEEIAKGAREADGVECILKSAREVRQEDFLHSQGIIAGSPVYYGSMAAELKAVFDSLTGIRGEMSDKVGAAFATSEDPSGGKETTMLSIIQAMLINTMIVAGDPLDATGHYGISCTGAPDERTCRNAAKLGKRVALLAQKLHGGK